MAKEPLIGSRTKGFLLKGRGYSLGGGSSDSSSLEQFLSLPTQLAFNRKEIPGTSYKDIVDQALERAVPGSRAQAALLKEESQAIARIKDEAESALKEGRRLRQLQAEATAAQTPGKTANDAFGIYKFWINEANTASQEGDVEYATIALRNAGNARDLAEKRSQVEGNKGEASYKKEQNKQLASLYNEWQIDDNAYKKAVREIDKNYQNGVYSGKVGDTLLYQLNTVYSQKISERKKFLGELAANDINSLGGKDVQTLSETYDKTLNGNFNETGKQTSMGLIDITNQIAERINNSNKYADVVETKFDSVTGQPSGYSIERKLKPAGDSGVAFIRDDFGRYVPLSIVDTPDGKSHYEAFVPDQNGNLTKIHSSDFNSKEQANKGALEGISLIDQSGRKLNNYSAFVGGPQANDQFDVFNKQNDNQFLKDNFNLDDQQIAQSQSLAAKQRVKSQNFLEQVVGGIKKTGQAFQALPEYWKAPLFPLGSGDVNKNNPIQVTPQAFNAAVAKPQIQLPKPLVAAPAPAFKPGTGTPSPVLSNTAPTGSIKIPATTSINLTGKPAANTTSGIKLDNNMTITGSSGNPFSQVGNKDIYVDSNEYAKVLNQYLTQTKNQAEAHRLTEEAFNTGGYKQYGKYGR